MLYDSCRPTRSIFLSVPHRSLAASSPLRLVLCCGPPSVLKRVTKEYREYIGTHEAHLVTERAV
jgi:hypothetical protein